MPKVVVIGGGWSGVAAAIRARKSGAEVVIAEKTDLPSPVLIATTLSLIS